MLDYAPLCAIHASFGNAAKWHIYGNLSEFSSFVNERNEHERKAEITLIQELLRSDGSGDVSVLSR